MMAVVVVGQGDGIAEPTLVKCVVPLLRMVGGVATNCGIVLRPVFIGDGCGGGICVVVVVVVEVLLDSVSNGFCTIGTVDDTTEDDEVVVVTFGGGGGKEVDVVVVVVME